MLVASKPWARNTLRVLTERQVERLIEAVKQNRSGHRDATAMLPIRLELVIKS
jgi:hypothetical protein